MKPTDEGVVREPLMEYGVALAAYDVALAAYDRILNETQRVNYGTTHCNHQELGGKCLAQVKKRICVNGHEVTV